MKNVVDANPPADQLLLCALVLVGNSDTNAATTSVQNLWDAPLYHRQRHSPTEAAWPCYAVDTSGDTAVGSGAPTDPWWWAPVALHYKKKRGLGARMPRFIMT
jgi:hypothetical protein